MSSRVASRLTWWIRTTTDGGLALVLYIHLNPVRARLVRHAGGYAWSSQRAYLGREALPWLTTDWVLGQFASRVATARTRFAVFVEAGREDGHLTLFYGGEDDIRVAGEADFLKQVLKPAAPPLIAWLAVQVRSCTIAEVAHYVSRAPSTMSHLVARLEKRSTVPAQHLKLSDNIFIQLYRPAPICPCDLSLICPR